MVFFFQAEDGIRDLVRSRGLGDVYKRQIPAFYMDNTEITNNEYRQFVYWVRDSLAHRLIGGEHLFEEGEYGERINWREKIKWEDDQNEETLAELFLPETERFYRRKEIDTRKLNFEYYSIDLKTAAQRKSREQGMRDRSVFIKKDVINVYPDTLAWIHDYAYSYHDPMTQMYFWHPAYDEYPVVGVTWKQARAFCMWRTQLLNSYLADNGGAFVQDYRLPTESEWEIAARGGLENSLYPWGSYYTRGDQGCFVANFKPNRGNYVADSPTGTTTMKGGEFDPNPYGLYDMAGNVAEWTSTAFFEGGYEIINDMNPELQYDAKTDDPPVMKRKVNRGGSWKDMAYFIRTSTRSFEYQDTTKSYVGFRCVRRRHRCRVPPSAPGCPAPRHDRPPSPRRRDRPASRTPAVR